MTIHYLVCGSYSLALISPLRREESVILSMNIRYIVLRFLFFTIRYPLNAICSLLRNVLRDFLTIA